MSFLAGGTLCVLQLIVYFRGNQKREQLNVDRSEKNLPLQLKHDFRQNFNAVRRCFSQLPLDLKWEQTGFPPASLQESSSAIEFQ